ncbi:MAG: NUDIX hydrolase [Candidatus Roizmanbacteria bacterium]|nr:MAG: NUDIX hydrolase [Candidatus Roizmanbacteria bacterium]
MLTCYFENNNKTSLRHVTVNAVVVKGSQVLLGKRGTYEGKPILESGKWALLGGFFGRDENLKEAVKREVMEESGWEIEDLQLLRINDNPNRPKEDRQNVDIIFFAKAAKQVKETDEEVKELRWFDLGALPPKEEIAFDHGEDLELYKKYLNEKILIPVLG